MLKWTQTLQVIQPLLMAAILASGHLRLWVLYADTLVAATIYAFNSPAQQALVPALVSRDELLGATALNSAVWTAARLVGPALGGALLLPLGAAWLFAINGLTTLAVLAALFGLRGVAGREAGARETVAVRGDALRYVRAHPGVRAILLITAGLTLLQGAFMVLLPVFARDVWHGGPSGYGLLLSATGAGAILGTVGLAALGAVRRPAVVVGGAVAVIGVALIAFAHAPALALGLALLVVAGAASASANAVLATQLQLAVPGDLRGRVMALRSIAFIGLGDFGSLLSSGLAQVAGPPTALTIAVAAIAATAIPQVRALAKTPPD